MIYITPQVGKISASVSVGQPITKRVIGKRKFKTIKGKFNFIRKNYSLKEISYRTGIKYNTLRNYSWMGKRKKRKHDHLPSVKNYNKIDNAFSELYSTSEITVIDGILLKKSQWLDADFMRQFFINYNDGLAEFHDNHSNAFMMQFFYTVQTKNMRGTWGKKFQWFDDTLVPTGTNWIDFISAVSARLKNKFGESDFKSLKISQFGIIYYGLNE